MSHYDAVIMRAIAEYRTCTGRFLFDETANAIVGAQHRLQSYPLLLHLVRELEKIPPVERRKVAISQMEELVGAAFAKLFAASEVRKRNNRVAQQLAATLSLDASWHPRW